MFEHFELGHIPALFVATTTTFGGMWSFFDARAAMLEFGLPDTIASTPSAAAVMQINNARTTAFGLCMYMLYFRRNFAACDTILAILGAYAGLVDSYVVWKEGNPRKAVFRLVSSGLISAMGFAGLTVSSRERTEGEWRALIDSCGLVVAGIYNKGDGNEGLIEVVQSV
ncbi:hypothetical protein GGR54DRAFT_642752 [Hypoxylon sp. NC1633]|nr:hypothetical protein GGR54DRAFT_642752 [Hypoxylon sp. NC1633]